LKKKNGLENYRDIIKKPMDLGTILKNIGDHKYLGVEALLEDVKLVWKNAKTYNKVGSTLHTYAKTMSKFFNASLRDIMKGKQPKFPELTPIPVQKNRSSYC